MSDLSQRVIVVTGSSKGIGAATARELHDRGASLVLHGRTDSEPLRKLAGELKDRVTVRPCDLRESESLPDFVNDCWNWCGRVDSWVNLAGADILTGTNSRLDFDRKLELLWQVDVRATLLLCRLVGQRMREYAAKSKSNGHYSLINTGWDQVLQGFAGDSGQLFGATKGAVMAATLSLAQELAPHVRVNCVAPGWIRTEWGESASDVWSRRAAEESLMNRWGTPADVARAICFLAGSHSGFVSGQILQVNGGFRHGAISEN